MEYRGLEHVHNKMDDDSKEEEEEFASNIIIMGVSMLLLALVTIAVFSNLGGGTKEETNFKSVNSICAKTESPEACLHVLKHIGERAPPSDYIKAAINATLEELLIVNIPKSDFDRSLTPLQTESYKDCLELLNMGKDELERLIVMANSSISKEMINSLSAIISYQQTCSNELLRTDNFDVLGYSLKLPILLSRITLAIVDNFFEKPAVDEAFEKTVTRGNHQAIEVENKRLIVAKDGRGHFTTITESLNACARNIGSCVIYVMKGVYEERVVIPKNLEQVSMYGDGPTQTIVTGINTRGLKIVTTPFRSASFVVKGKGFICKDMGFIAPANIAGAPALVVFSDHAAFFNCKIAGREGSLYAVAHRQFYGNCEIHGSLDIIKGDSATIIQNSRIVVKPQNSSKVLRKKVMSFQSRVDKHESTGFVIQNCTIVAEECEIDDSNNSLVGSTCLGIPCNEHSRIVVMESFLGDVIRPRGWCKWSDNYGIDTASFIEYDNRGIGARTGKRVHWDSYREVSQNQKSEMMKFTADEFIQADHWLKNTVIPYESGLFFHK